VAAGGLLFDGPAAFALGWTGAIVGSTTTFLVVRYLARDAVQASLERRFPRLTALDDRFAAHGFRTVLLLRLALFLSPPLNWALGATRVRLGHYIAATAVGIVPGVALCVYFADAILARDGAGGASLLVRLGVAGLLLGGVAVLGRWFAARAGAPATTDPARTSDRAGRRAGGGSPAARGG
jgi:uncharacterized membrane protein YdjX (TVP38/TMEM64 family)